MTSTNITLAAPAKDAPKAVTDPHAQRMPGSLATLLAQCKAELLPSVRTPAYLVGVIAIPVILYAMFALPNAAKDTSSGTSVGALLYASFCCYGVVSLAIFTFGEAVASERDKQWLRRMRSTPMPMWVYFTAKMIIGVALSAVILAGVWLVARFIGHVPFDTHRLLRTVGVLLLGTVAFSTFGYAIAYWCKPKAASAIANLVFLPLSFLSGYFMPLNMLPEAFQKASDWLPTYHFGQLAWSQMAQNPQEVADLGNRAPGTLWVHLAWVVGCFLACGALTVIGYRRDIDRSRA